MTMTVITKTITVMISQAMRAMTGDNKKSKQWPEAVVMATAATAAEARKKRTKSNANAKNAEKLN
jgi:hypothetical protein